MNTPPLHPHEDSLTSLSLPDSIAFLDICAGTSHRLDYWREMAKERGEPDYVLSASFAIDIEPRSPNVLKADVLSFLRSLKAQSVKEVNGDFFYITQNDSRVDSDGTQFGLSSIMVEVKRVLTPEGVFWATVPLSFDSDIRKAATSCNMSIEPKEFGYIGFLGGANKRFPSQGLPPVAQVTPQITERCRAAKYAEEEDPLGVLFAEFIGTHGYVGSNPVRYKITYRR